MSIQNKFQNNQKVSGNKFFPGQIITSEDLVDFKLDLLDEIKSIFKEIKDHGGKKWLRSRDVKERLGISHGTLQNLRTNGALPYTKVGGVIFYDQDDITKMITSNRLDSTF